jgi:hypothetical protein
MNRARMSRRPGGRWASALALAGVTIACGPGSASSTPDGGARGDDAALASPDGAADSGTPVRTDGGSTPGDSGGPTHADSGANVGDVGVTGPDGSTGQDAGHAEAGHAADSAVAGGIGPGSDKCATATDIPLSSTHVDLPASTAGAMHDIDAPCAPAGGADVFYQFSVSKPVLVYADTFGANFNTVLFLLTSACVPIAQSTTGGDAVCNDDGCGSQQSQVVALLNPGNYRLGLSGVGAAEGAATIHFEYAIAASGTESPLPQGTTVQSGTTTGSSGNIDDMSPSCIAAGPENGYWWTSCPSDPGGELNASTCGSAQTWETVLETEIPESAPYACTLDTCFPDTTISATVPMGAGLRVLLVDGQAGTDQGAYSMNVTRP